MSSVEDKNPIRFDLNDLFSRYQIDLLWVKNLSTIKYLAGFTGSAANLLIAEDGRRWILVDGRYTTQAAKECRDAEVKLVTKPISDLSQTVRELGVGRLGFEAKEATYSDYTTLKEELPDVELAAVKENLASLRIVKSADELKKLSRASEMSARAFDEFKANIHIGWSEKEAAWFLERRFRELGAEGLSFDTLVCSGPHSAVVHGKPTDRLFEKGDLVIVDRGLMLDHFASDETNTFVLGRADAKQKEIYRIVKEAHDRSIEAVKPGVKCVDIDKAARDIIDKAGYADYFGHGTGHGVGIEVHEMPVISPRGEGVVEEGMVFSIEPGIYIPGWGGVRIEDLVVVRADGCETITKADKDDFELMVD